MKTVSELIEELQKFPKDMEVLRRTEGFYGEILWFDPDVITHKCLIDGELKEFVAI